jgi:hypothetical protein
MMLNFVDVLNNNEENNGESNDENNNFNGLIERKKEDLFEISSRNERTNGKKSSKHKRKHRSRIRCFCNKCKKSKSRESLKRKRRNSEYIEENLNMKQRLIDDETKERESKKRKNSFRRSHSVSKRSRSRSKETRRRKYSEYVDSYYLSGRFRESMPLYKEIPTLLSQRNDDINFKDQIRYPRHSFKYQGFRTNYRFYPHYYQNDNTSNNNNNYYQLFSKINNDESTKIADTEISIVDDYQSDILIQQNSNSNQQKQMNSKIIDLLDTDWSIMDNKYFNNSIKIDSDYQTSYNPAFILSTIETINDCLDEKLKEKIKDFIGKDKTLKDKNTEDDCSFISGLNSIKNKIRNKTIINNLFKANPGICMRNDVERRKALFFHQINKKFNSLNFEDKVNTSSSNDSKNVLVPPSATNLLNGERDYEFRHIDFYNQVIHLLKDDKNDSE